MVYGATAADLILQKLEGLKKLDEEQMKQLELLNMLCYLLQPKRKGELQALTKKIEKSANKAAESMATSVATLVSSAVGQSSAASSSTEPQASKKAKKSPMELALADFVW